MVRAFERSEELAMKSNIESWNWKAAGWLAYALSAGVFVIAI